MFFANLSLLEFLVLFGGIGVSVTLLYLLDRSRRKIVVATLRFWNQALAPTEARRRRIHEPLSLLLQLLCIALLLLAIAQLRIGDSEDHARDHILIVDASAWTGAQSAAGTLMDEIHSSALAYIRALPKSDRVMIIRAGGLATPMTSFETDRQVVEEAVSSIEPGAGALDLDRVLRVARRIQRLHSTRPGEITFAGGGRYSSQETLPLSEISNLRYLPAGAAPPNVGLTRIGLRHSQEEANLWDVLVAVRNYGEAPVTVDLALQYSDSPAGFEKLDLEAEGSREVRFPLRTQAGGTLEARLFPADEFPGDDYATLTLPARPRIPVTVYSRRPELLRPLLRANNLVAAEFRRPEEYRPAESGIVILDGFAPTAAPDGDVIWIDPPASGSPVEVARQASNAEVTGWIPDHVLGDGLRIQDLKLSHTLVFRPNQSYATIAEVSEGPVIVARGGNGYDDGKTVVLGFHPMEPGIRYRLAAPLLFANVIRWMRPELFRHWEMAAGSVGTVNVPLEEGLDPDEIEVVAGNGERMPFRYDGSTLQFYSGNPGTVRIVAGERELVYSLTLPAVPDQRWEAPEGVKRGIPQAAASLPEPSDLWYWLALLAAAGLIYEWMRFGRYRRASGARSAPVSLFGPQPPGTMESPVPDSLRRTS